MPLGIPHSRFLGWDPDDQDKALAYVRDQRDRCPGCNTRRDDWADDPDVYVGWHEVCPGCERIEQEHDNVERDTKGVRFTLMPRELALFLMEQGQGLGNK